MDDVSNATVKKNRYAFVVFFTALFVCFCLMGMFNSLRTHTSYICKLYGFGRGDYLLLFSLQSITDMVFNVFFFAYLYKKVGARVIQTICAFIGGIALIVFSQATTLPVFYLSGILLGASFFGLSISFINVIISTWFQKNRGFFISFAAAGTGLGGFVWNLVTAQLLPQYSSQTIIFYFGIAMLFVAILPAIFTRNNPEDKGLKPYGFGEEIKQKKQLDRGEPSYDLSYGQAFMKPFFYFTLLGIFLLGIVITPISSIIAPRMADAGFAPAFAATVMSIFYLILAGLKIVLGALYDRFGGVFILILGTVSGLIGYFLLNSLSSTLVLVLFLIIFPMATCAQSVQMPLIISKVFGKKELRKYIGLGIGALGIGATIGVPLTGYMFDYFGSYSNLLTIIYPIGLILSSIFLYLGLIGSKKYVQTLENT